MNTDNIKGHENLKTFILTIYIIAIKQKIFCETRTIILKST